MRSVLQIRDMGLLFTTKKGGCFRRIGGKMEPHRRPAGRRPLLPAEAELCNAVGLSEDEYWHFVDEADAYTGERNKEYEQVPDVRNDPVSIVVSLVTGLP